MARTSQEKLWRPGLMEVGDGCFTLVTPATFGANIGNWIRVAERILQMKVRTVVPGHGPVGDRQTLKAMLGYLTFVRQETRKRFRAGMSARRAAADIGVGKYVHWQKPDPGSCPR